MKNSILEVANSIANNNNSQSIVSLQLKSDWSQFLRIPRKKQEKLDRVVEKQFELAFPNGCFKLSNVNGSLFGKTSYTTYMKNKTGDENFVAQKPSGMSHVEGLHNILVADKDSNQFYIMFNLSLHGLERSKAVYIDNNDNIISEEYVEAQSEIFTGKGIPSKIREDKAKSLARTAERQAKEGEVKAPSPFVTFTAKFETIQKLSCGASSYGEKIEPVK